MHEATVTIIRKNPPGPGKVMWDLVAETGEKFKAFEGEARLFDEGKRYRLNFEPKEFKAADGRTFPFNSIKGTPKLVERPEDVRSISPTDVGPHVGMWEKEAFDALRAGMTSSQVIIMGIEARQAARVIVRTDLDGKLPAPPTDDPNDSLEF